MKLIFITMFTFWICVGCAGINKAIDEHELAASLAVRAATSRVLSEHPHWANKTYRLTAQAINVIESDGVSDLDGLKVYIVGQINWSKLSPEEQVLLDVVINAAVDRLKESLEKRGVVSPGESMVHAAKVLTWINQTAHMRM